MSMTVKGQDGHTYRVTGKFAEPEHTQPFWNFITQNVNFYNKSVGLPWGDDVSPFGNRAVLLERVPTAYLVTVTLTQEQLEYYRNQKWKTEPFRSIADAIANGRFTEVAQETE